MSASDFNTSIIQTKLHQPALQVDLVPRPRLTDLLNPDNLPPFILISAPAGYGKSTLMKCLLKALDCPTAWLSLDEHDNDLDNFLRYFIAAIQRIFPDALLESRASLMAAPLPPLSAIAKNLINELNQLEQSFVLALDDYHVIHTPAIHDLLNELLIYPPRNFHLLMGTRMDPPLPLTTLRANGKMLEIRTQDLRFTQEETLILFQSMVGDNVDLIAIDDLNIRVEGWVTGLRLAALAMRHRIGRDSFDGELSLQNLYVTEYLVSEILAKQAASLSDCMLKISILDRFCAELCEAIYFGDGEQTHREDFSGVQFTEWLRNSNLFVIPLDDRGEWFRYHHLFRDFLQQELAQRISPDGIARLHTAAGDWYAFNGLPEEALYHLLAANDTTKAIQLVAQNRYSMMNTTQWPRLERWLDQFSNQVVENSPELWMLKTWLVYHRGQFSQLPGLLKHLNTLLESDSIRAANNHLAGEISALRSLIAYHSGDAELAVSEAELALDLLPPELWIVRVMARMYLSGSYLLQGEENRGYNVYYEVFEKEKVANKHYKATLLMTACNYHWITADLRSMSQAAKQCIALCEETGQQEILGYGKYQLGRVLYHQDNLTAAERLFADVVSRPYLNYGISYTNSACGLAMTYQAQGKETEAQKVADDAVAFLIETGNTSQLPIVRAVQAELALLQGRISQAGQWADKLDSIPPLSPMPYFLAPHLTLVKVWIAQSTPTTRAKASGLLGRLQEYLAGIHNTRFLIEARALQALLHEAKGNRIAALEVLEQALGMAQPGGFIRLFIDLGQQMESLIVELKAGRDLQAYANQIRSAFPRSHPSVSLMSREILREPLTNRELEVLALLAERKTNKEIALRLGITPGTVRQHAYNIYQKLAVSNRREAVNRAYELGLFAN